MNCSPKNSSNHTRIEIQRRKDSAETWNVLLPLLLRAKVSFYAHAAVQGELLGDIPLFTERI